MAIVAPVSKYKMKTFRIYIIICIIVAAILAYDGYLSKYEWSYRYSFYTKHFIDKDNKPDTDMLFNQKAPPYLIGVAVLLGIYSFAILRNRKIVADDNALIIDGKPGIPYDSVQKIDKTDFDKKGYFIFTYKTPDGKEIDRKISDRSYDNLKAILDHLVAKIS